MTASQPLFCLNVNLFLDNQGGSIHDVLGRYHNLLNCYTIPQADIQGEKLY